MISFVHLVLSLNGLLQAIASGRLNVSNKFNDSEENFDISEALAEYYNDDVGGDEDEDEIDDEFFDGFEEGVQDGEEFVDDFGLQDLTDEGDFKINRKHLDFCLFYLDLNREEMQNLEYDEENPVFEGIDEEQWEDFQPFLCRYLDEAEKQERVVWKENGGPQNMNELNSLLSQRDMTPIALNDYEITQITYWARIQSSLKVIS